MSTAPVPSSPRTPAAALRLLRPAQWAKNGFVLIGVLFGHAWTDPLRVQAALVAFGAFCAIASAVYVVNDWFDRERDRLHPRKRHRPIASGAIGGGLAAALAAACAAAALGATLAPALGAVPGADGGRRLLALLGLYVALNVGYSLGLKRVPILDCALIALGFMLRILAGTWAIGIEPSRWLIVCGLAVTLFLAFAKRRAELAALGDDAAGHRAVLERYSLPLLDQFLAITATAVLVTYSVYTVSADTVRTHGTDLLIWTLPCVAYGLFRYLYIVFQRGAGGDPTRDLVTDGHLLAAGGAWLAITIWALRGGA
ncbi:MAG TPA: decaprenyl-phosphate phosphoribosyltransferase [Burkholderiaceae bacterium]|nr:decaprenyl-phosphate phosphoribosyltransferase [Burkholderiaceae bacterium]